MPESLLSKAGLKAVPLFLCLFWPARKTKKEKSPLARRKEEEASGAPPERRKRERSAAHGPKAPGPKGRNLGSHHLSLLA